MFFSIYMSVIGIAAVALLLPSYFFLQFQINELRALEKATTNSSDYKDMESGEKAAQKIRTLVSVTNKFFQSGSVVTPLVEDIISRMPASVSISDFSYISEAGKQSTLQLVGIAGHRDDLKKFAEALQKSPYVKEKVLIPESSYKNERDAPFTIPLVIDSTKL